MNKIPCSIGILTLNSGKTLRRCLDSVKDFAEIVVCDGNSTDNTLNIAREYGVKIVKQYDSDEPNLRCVKDKANVRQRNMDAASYDWYFFMDSDDALSRGVVEEIRKITADPASPFFVYRMPTRLFLDGKEIKHEASYPSYQTRLINRKIKPYFKGRVHDRLMFDQKKYKVGALKSFYDFHWPKERVENYMPIGRRMPPAEGLGANFFIGAFTGDCASLPGIYTGFPKCIFFTDLKIQCRCGFSF